MRRQFEQAIKKIREEGPDAGAATAAAQERETTVSFVTDVIISTVAGMLFVDKREMKATNTVADHGVDSLLATEFRNWLNIAFGKNISMLDLMDARASINALAANVVDEAIGK